MPDLTDPSNWSQPWTATDTCTRYQAALAEWDIKAWMLGEPHASFDALRAVVAPILGKFASFLEIGSGAGYGCFVLWRIDTACQYVGCDISPHMVEYARERWGKSEKWPFVRQDEKLPRYVECSADSLWADDCSFDVTCLAAVIQHMPDYRPAVQEAIRVSRRYVILHRVEACEGPTNEFLNPAYNTELPTREINEAELLAYCESVGLKLINAVRWGLPAKRWNATFLLEKA